MSNFLRASPRLYGVDNPSTNSHSKTKQENNARVNDSTQPHNLNKETHVRNIPDLYVQLADAIDGTFLDLLTLDIHVVCMRHTNTQWIAWCVSEFVKRDPTHAGSSPHQCDRTRRQDQRHILCNGICGGLALALKYSVVGRLQRVLDLHASV